MNYAWQDQRCWRLIKQAISNFELDLSGLSVLTEAGSGPCPLTPIIAAVAGAHHVVAVTRDSRHGRAMEIAERIRELAGVVAVAPRIRVTTEPPASVAQGCHVVTNLGFVRPIDAALIDRLPSDAAVAMMFEPWESRAEDIDVAACRRRGIPVMGTNERHPHLQLFRYVGMTAMKLLFEANVEVFRSRVLVVGSDPFGAETLAALNAAGAATWRWDPTREDWATAVSALVYDPFDAIVVVEFRSRATVIGGNGIPLRWVAECGVPVIRICGQIDDDGLDAHNVERLPARGATPGFMAVTTAYVGPRPVIDLHTGDSRSAPCS